MYIREIDVRHVIQHMNMIYDTPLFPPYAAE